VPRFEGLLDSFNRAPPLAMSLLLAASGLFRLCAPPLAAVLGAAAIFFMIRRRDAGFRLAVHRRLLKIPGIGGLLAKIETERITFLLGTLLAAGVDVPGAVAATGAAMPNEALRAGLALVERGVARGDGVARSLEAAALLPDLALALVRVGEETGDLATMLLKASDILRREVEATTAQLIGLIAPISIVVLGVLIGAVALALFGTIMEVYDIAA
jgi:type II secretory pathway component PulF